MKYTVSCTFCRIGDVAECPNQDDAEQLVRRHHTLHGHDAVVTRRLDTPLEGLL